MITLLYRHQKHIIGVVKTLLKKPGKENDVMDDSDDDDEA